MHAITAELEPGRGANFDFALAGLGSFDSKLATSRLANEINARLGPSGDYRMNFLINRLLYLTGAARNRSRGG